MSRPSPEGVSCSQETEKVAHSVAVFVAVFVAFVAIFLPLILSRKAAQDRAHARRIADAKMNARLLRLNL
jgi:uncharacterized protein (UPF0212 family)